MAFVSLASAKIFSCPFMPAGKTAGFVDADQVEAFGAGPLLPLFFDEPGEVQDPFRSDSEIKTVHYGEGHDHLFKSSQASAIRKTVDRGLHIGRSGLDPYQRTGRRSPFHNRGGQSSRWHSS